MPAITSVLGNFSPKYAWYAISLIIAITSFIYLFQLGQGAFIDYDEATYAEVTQDTLASGNILTLQEFGQTWFEKPPLYIWSAMAAGDFIQTRELAYRLPAALSGILSIVLVMLITYSVSESYIAACIAGLILMTSPLFLEAARQVRMDVPVTSAILFSVYSFIRGLKNEKWHVGVGFGVAIGILTKSVIGLFPFGFIAIHALVYKDFTWIKSKFFWIGIGLMCIIVLPWHLYETVIYRGAFWDTYLFQHVIERASTNILAGGAADSNSQYFYYLFVYGEPWPMIFVLAMPFLWVLYRRGHAIKPILVFSLFTLSVLGLFLLAATKLSYYLTPMYPFCAIALALLAYSWIERFPKALDHKNALIALAAAIFCLALGTTIYTGLNLAPAYWVNQYIANEERDVGKILAANPTPQDVYAHLWPDLNTLRYYAGGRPVRPIVENEVINTSYFLLVHSELKYNFPPAYQAQLTLMYKGQAATLYKFTR